jgi:hypothetical protein
LTNLTGPEVNGIRGFFSYLQSLYFRESSTFSSPEITTNLSNHALYGGAKKGTMEHEIKTTIMDYLNIV